MYNTCFNQDFHLCLPVGLISLLYEQRKDDGSDERQLSLSFLISAHYLISLQIRIQVVRYKCDLESSLLGILFSIRSHYSKMPPKVQVAVRVRSWEVLEKHRHKSWPMGWAIPATKALLIHQEPCVSVAIKWSVLMLTGGGVSKAQHSWGYNINSRLHALYKYNIVHPICNMWRKEVMLHPQISVEEVTPKGLEEGSHSSQNRLERGTYFARTHSRRSWVCSNAAGDTKFRVQ